MEIAYRQGHEEAGLAGNGATQLLHRSKTNARGKCQHGGSP